ncbi:S8 family serine peptidase [Lewinella sp. JB7]|uniref:S8 family peptidase n=1 Tax=Lewinella sp. JB7 TaxID=2962887 RepID=UPI0020C9CD50|nr:S8 family serine peptidase [Lewinella sp. JB7]MCP9237114.1 S8 family serine peptidase [Lewinella sp. JB7]
MLLLTALVLSVWFWRRNAREAPVWMMLTYLGVGVMAWEDFASVSTAASAFPKILKDFIMLGMVGFVQSMAVKKQISVWMAVVLIFGMFAAVHYLDELINTDEEVETFTSATDDDWSYLVELHEGATAQQLEDFARMNHYRVERAFFPEAASETYLDNYYTLSGNADRPLDAEVLNALTTVLYSEPNETIQVEPFIVGDRDLPAGKQSLSINDPFTGEQWAMEVLQMDDYYRLLHQLRPRKQAKVVILDTGVDGDHEDLTDNYFSIESKYDNDPHGHGTHCAGIAAGVTNNGIGIGSLAGGGDSPFVEISSVKVLSAGGMGTQKTIIAGIIEATDEGADVISLSLGGRSTQSSQRAYSAAIQYAHRNGAVVVAAAGNSNRDAKDYAPANADGMITVAAIDQLLLRAPFSNRTDKIEMAIAAPGVGIYSTVPGNGYKSYSGTSMACPFVAGLIGVMKSIDPALNHRDAYRIIHETGRESSETRITGRIVQPAATLARIAR